MRTVVVQGGWRMWALLIVGGALLLTLGLVAMLVFLGLALVGSVLLLGYRALLALGLVSRPTPVARSGGAPDGVVDADFQVVGQRAITERQPDTPGTPHMEN